MNRVSSRCIAVCLFASFCGTAFAQPAGEPRRIRGLIDKDETWSGTILITDNLIIDGATVKVLPGTTIEFAGGSQFRRPVLTVGAEVRPGTDFDAGPGNSDSKVALDPMRAAGRLEMTGTPEQPIIVRTAAGSGPGRLVVVVRNRKNAVRLEQGKLVEDAPTSQTADQLDWKHVRFERLGYTESKRDLQLDVDVSKPAVLFMVRTGGQSIALSDCSFKQCAQLLIHTAAECKVRVAGCRFEDAIETASLRCVAVAASDVAASIDVVDNFADGMFVMSAGPAALTGNRLIGPRAGMAIRSDAIGDIRLESNYVHCTVERDTGRYVLNVERPDAIVKDNVLIGGTYVVNQGSRQMSGNVLIAAQQFEGDKGGKGRTHRLVAALPAGSDFSGNVLIGPAFALLGPQKSLMPTRGDDDNQSAAVVTRVFGNVFDGTDGITKAMQLGLPRGTGGAFECFNNLIVRCGPMIADSSMKSDALAYADFNAIIGGPKKLLQRTAVVSRREGEEGWSKSDVRHPSLDKVGLAALPDSVPNLDADVARGAMSIQEARRRLMAPYRPRKYSPLMDAGRPTASGGKPGTIGIESSDPN